MSTRPVIPRELGYSSRKPPISNTSLATMLFLAAEAMLFVGMIAGYVVLRFGSNDFQGMETLPVGLTAVSTPLILLSSLTLIATQRAFSKGKNSPIRLWAVLTLLLALLFLAFQLVEWNHLLGEGLDPDNNVSNGMFYMLTGIHGLHVLGGLILLAILAVRAARNSMTAKRKNFMTLTSYYWHFVTLVWIALFCMMFLL